MTRFTSRIHPHVQAELDAARRCERRADLCAAFRHLERAHVLGQASTREHVRVHWQMLRFAQRHQYLRDVMGQAWRLATSAIFTLLRLVPTGNTGGTNVNGFQRMDVPRDLMAIIASTRD